MSINIGVWLDRSKAIIVRVDEKTIETVTLSSDLADMRHPKNGTRGRCTIIPENKQRQHKQDTVKKFYQKIIETIRNAGAILILGPGIAKTELINEFGAHKILRARIVGFETTDKMSSRQIESKVRKFFNAMNIKPSMKTSILCALKHCYQ